MSEKLNTLSIGRVVIHHGGKLLLIKRSSQVSYEKGCWEIPGGKSDVGSSFVENVAREVQEETGLKVSIKHPATTVFMEELADKKTKYKNYRLITLVFEVDCFKRKLKTSVEHDAWRWVTAEEALGLKLTKGTRKILEFLRKSQKSR